MPESRIRLGDRTPGPPILFGSEATQLLLVDLLRDGPSAAPKPDSIRSVLRTGLIAASGSPEDLTIALNDRHPAIGRLREVLAELSGSPALSSETLAHKELAPEISASRPLGHSSALAFLVLTVVNKSDGGLSMQEIMHRVVTPSGVGLNELLDRLVENGILSKGVDGRFRFTEAVPTAYRALLDELGVYLAPKDPRVAQAVAPHVWEPVYLTQARDGAPKLFGPDTRLRNLMALAKHGPLDIMDLRWITGNSSLLLESEGTAPFGRGGLVRVWKSGTGNAAALDPAYPAARELKALLLKLESSFPLPNRPRLRPTPPLPPLDVWEGDKLELFGGPIRTSILISIGALGWTFEALCVETATGYHRENIKNSLAQLEVEGVVISSRERRPGFNVRAVTIAESFSAREELLALLKACVEVWPGFAASVNAAMDRLTPRTIEHLHRRKLKERDPWGPPEPGKDLASLKLRKRKAEVLDEYLTVAEQLGFFPSTADLTENTRLIQRITACWGKFSTFCDETGVTPHYKRRPNDETGTYIEPRRLSVKAMLKLDVAIKTEEQRTCVLRYRELNEAHGKALTSNELMVTDSNLYNSIRAKFGTFVEFRRSARIPGRRTGQYSKPGPHLRQRCIRQYAELTSLLGEAPNASAVQRENPSLYGYIRTQWGTFAEFCIDTGVSPPGHQRSMNAGYDVWRKRCIAEYADLTVKLGFPPTSRQLQAHSNGLYKRVRKIWGGFGPFRAEIGVPAVTRGIYNANKRRAALHGTGST